MVFINNEDKRKIIVLLIQEKSCPMKYSFESRVDESMVEWCSMIAREVIQL